MSSETEIRSEFFDIVHDTEGEDDEEPHLPGWEMLFRVPDLKDRHTRITVVIIILVLSSLIVNLLREKLRTKHLMIQNIVYLTAGYLTALVSSELVVSVRCISLALFRLRNSSIRRIISR